MKRQILLGLFISLLFAPSAAAFEDRGFINIVNPVRVSRYLGHSGPSLQAQYKVISEFNLPATWLVTYEALANSEILPIIKSMNSAQEIGIFMEVTPDFAQAAGIEYHQTGSWHFANAVFLSGYTQEERLKLIDTVFVKFKGIFNRYPSTVGAWWIDSFSLNYMQQKYNIVATLGCADQFVTDNYQLWGQYWSAPFYPSKNHAGIPAQTVKDKIPLVKSLWAARDPEKGYASSLYSTQDYLMKGLDINYFEKLVRLYAWPHSNKFGQIVVGLEADLLPDEYNKEFRKQMQLVAKLSNEVQVVTLEKFSKWYVEEFPGLSPDYKTISDNAVWEQTPFYRKGTINGKIVDWRIYPPGFEEPYNLWPNRENSLMINLPALIDSMSNSYDFRTADIKGWKFNRFIFTDWSIETRHAFSSVKFWLRLFLGKGWNLISRQRYVVEPDEMLALFYLKYLPTGNVMVLDQECLQCEYFGAYKPAVFANLRNYIARLSGKKVIKSMVLLKPGVALQVTKVLKQDNISYLYLVKYGNYLETLPYSPGDLGVEKIYENARVQIWKVR